MEKTERLGSHDLFLAKVAGVTVDERYMDEKGRFALERTGLIAYSHGAYYALGKQIGRFGYSVKKKTDGTVPAGRGNKTKGIMVCQRLHF